MSKHSGHPSVHCDCTCINNRFVIWNQKILLRDFKCWVLSSILNEDFSNKFTVDHTPEKHERLSLIIHSNQWRHCKFLHRLFPEVESSLSVFMFSLWNFVIGCKPKMKLYSLTWIKIMMLKWKQTNKQATYLSIL